MRVSAGSEVDTDPHHFKECSHIRTSCHLGTIVMGPGDRNLADRKFPPPRQEEKLDIESEAHQRGPSAELPHAWPVEQLETALGIPYSMQLGAEQSDEQVSAATGQLTQS